MRAMMVLAASVAAALSFPVHAAATSSASITGLKFQLIDLDTSDGVTPYITFASGQGFGGVVAVDLSENDFLYGNDSRSANSSGLQIYANRSVSQTIASGTASASVSGNGTSPVSLSSSGTVTAPVGAGVANYGASARVPGDYWYGYNFSLSANTLLKVTGVATVSASAGGALFGYEYASAGVSAELGGLGPLGVGGQQSSFNDTAYQWAYYTPAVLSDTRIQKFGLAFSNFTDADLSGHLALTTSVNGQAYSYVAAVPEPETYAMMLAGLLVLTVRARRSRQS